MLGRKSKMADGKKSKRTRKLLDKKMTGCGHKTVQCFNTKCLHQELFFIKDRKKKKKKMKKKKKKEERKRFFFLLLSVLPMKTFCVKMKC